MKISGLGMLMTGIVSGLSVPILIASALGAQTSPLTLDDDRSNQPIPPHASRSEPGLEGSDLSMSVAMTTGVRDAKGQASIEVAVKHTLEEAADVGSVFEVLDPHNRAVVEAEFSQPQRGIDPSRELKETFSIPTDLKDGYYVARATAVAATQSGTSRASDEKPFRVRGLTTEWISREEFNELSGVNDSID